MISKMKKLSLVLLKSDEEAVLNDLIWLKTIEVSDPGDVSGDSIVVRRDCSEEILSSENKIETLESAIKLLSPMRKDKKKALAPKRVEKKEVFISPDSNVGKAEAAAEEAIELRKRNEKAKEDIRKMNIYLTSIAPWKDYSLPLGYSGDGSIRCEAGLLPLSVNLDNLNSKLEEASEGAFELTEVSRGNALCVSVIYHKAYRNAVLNVLGESGFTKNLFPVNSKTAKEEIQITESKIKELEESIENSKAKMEELATYCTMMETAADVERTKVVKLRQKEKLLETGHTILMTGWVPERNVGRLEKKLEKYTCFCELADPVEGDDVPTELYNGPFGDAYSMIVSMYGYPKYGSVDPSFITGIFFALMLGMIFSDAGYGLLFLIAAIIGLVKMKPEGGTKRLLIIVGTCGFSCIVCGVLFGGYFGDLPTQIAQNIFHSHALDNLAIVCNPVSEPMTFIVISLVVGVIHLLSGLAIQMVQLFKKGDWKAAVFDVGSWFFIYIGLALAFLVNMIAGIVVASIGLLMLISMRGRAKKNIFARIFNGIAGLYDMVNFATDVLSYSRIFALALSGAVIASVVNTLATMGGSSVLSVVMMIVIIPFGHLLNIAVSAIGAFVHTLRLQFLEFYGKFFDEGGRGFDPALPDLKYVSVKDTEND